LLREAGFEKLDSSTIAFGPFSLFKCALLPRKAGIRLGGLLQGLADSGVPILLHGSRLHRALPETVFRAVMNYSRGNCRSQIKTVIGKPSGWLAGNSKGNLG
jgi:hypothetical protein